MLIISQSDFLNYNMKEIIMIRYQDDSPIDGLHDCEVYMEPSLEEPIHEILRIAQDDYPWTHGKIVPCTIIPLHSIDYFGSRKGGPFDGDTWNKFQGAVQGEEVKAYLESTKSIYEINKYTGAHISGYYGLSKYINDQLHELTNKNMFVVKERASSENPIGPIHSAVIARRKTLMGYIYELAIKKPGLYHDLMHIARTGVVPIGWFGRWPDGFAVANVIPDHPVQGLPPAYQVPPDVLKRLTTKQPAKPPLPIPTPTVPVVGVNTWTSLKSATDPRDAVARHFSALAETDACRGILSRVASHARLIGGPEVFSAKNAKLIRLRKTDQALVIRFDGPEQQVFLHCTAPYIGPLDGLPKSVAAVARLHNGMQVYTLRNDDLTADISDHALTWLPFAKGKFTLDWPGGGRRTWKDYWAVNEYDPDEPFRTAPMIPMMGEYDPYVLMPLRHRSPGEPDVCRLSHSSALVKAPVPYPIGGVFLRYLLNAIDPSYQFGDLFEDSR